MQPIYIIMGVCGVGKTTIGKLWSEKKRIPFYDADDFHPEVNIKKMSAGYPLNDNDRIPWLKILAENIQKWQQQDGAVLACSALKEQYRELLSLKTTVQWIYLYGNYEDIWKRMQSRAAHYMKPEMLQSQLATLEAPKYGIHIDISHSPEAIIDHIDKILQARGDPAENRA